MRERLLAISLLLILTAAALSPVLFDGFTNWDDQIMITQNTKITSLSPDNLKLFFTAPHERLYHPLVLLSYAVDYKIAGMNPFIFHLTNLILHLLTTVLVFWFIYLLTGRTAVSFLAALLFGIHPMHVESVVWLSERKDVLYAFFFLGALVSYLKYKKTGRQVFSALTLVLFLLSLLSKPMALTLPFLLLLIDYFLDCKLDLKKAREKWPYYILFMIFTAVMIWAHYYSQAIEPIPAFSIINKLGFVCYGIIFYIVKLFFPLKLSNYYPLPHDPQGLLPIAYYLAPAALLLLAAGVLFSLKYTRKIFFGGMFFLIVIAPVLQIMPVGIGVLADRYTYISYIGLFYILSSGIVWVYDRKPQFKALILVVLVLITGALCFLTFQRALIWKDGLSLWEDVIKKYPEAALAYYNRGDEYFLRLHDYDRAYADFSRAIEIDPTYTSAYINRGLIKYYRGKIEDSVKDFNQALKYDPKIGEAYGNRGNSYRALGNRARALIDYSLALKYKPNYPETFYNRANLYVELGQYEKAYADYEQAVKLKPDYAAAYNNLGNAYFRAGDLGRAFNSFDRAISADPNYPDAYYNRSVIYANRKQYRLALLDASRAASLGFRIDPRYIEKLKRYSE